MAPEEEEEEAPPLFIFLVETTAPVRGAMWGKRPPARSPAAGVVEGSGGPLGFRVAGAERTVMSARGGVNRRTYKISLKRSG